MEIKDLIGLSKPLEKLIDVCSSGLGKIIEPRQIRKIADSKAYEIKIITQALLESKEKLGSSSQYVNGEIKFIVDKSDPYIIENTPNNATIINPNTEKEYYSDEIEILQNGINTKKTYINLKKEKNIYNTLNFTMNEFEGILDEEVSDEKVDEDWISRFFDTIEDINNEKLQKLWAKILVGEIKQPNSYSLRTLELLRNLSFSEAELFSKIANFVIQDSTKTKAFLLSDKSILSKFNISFHEILTLQDLDLIHPNILQYGSSIKNEEYNSFLILGTELICIKLPKNIKYSLNVYSLSSIGKELLNLVKRVPIAEYKKELSIEIKNNNQEIKLFSNLSMNKEGTYDPSLNIEI